MFTHILDTSYSSLSHLGRRSYANRDTNGPILHRPRITLLIFAKFLILCALCDSLFSTIFGVWISRFGFSFIFRELVRSLCGEFDSIYKVRSQITTESDRKFISGSRI